MFINQNLNKIFKMKSKAKPVTSQASNDVQSLIDLISTLREENKLLRTSNKKLAKKARLAGTKNANMASTVNVLSSQLARATADQQQRRQELTRLNNACASYKQRIAALESSSRSLASFPTAADIHPSPPPPSSSSAAAATATRDPPFPVDPVPNILIGTKTSLLDISLTATTSSIEAASPPTLDPEIANVPSQDGEQLTTRCRYIVEFCRNADEQIACQKANIERIREHLQDKEKKRRIDDQGV